MIDKVVEYPSSWEVMPLGEFVHSEKGKKPKRLCEKKTDTCNIPYIDIKAFEKNIIEKYTDGINCRISKDTDILIVWDGSRSGLVGKGVDGALGSTLARVNFFGLNNNYAFYFLKSKYQEINSRAKGAATPHVDPELLWNYQFPIPPLSEQHRIVEKIETLFSELDSGIKSLKTAKAQLKQYRQSVLKSAFEGKLTEAWRKEHADELESAESLLERIKVEREASYEHKMLLWQEAVKVWEENGKEGKKPTKPKKLKELPALAKKDILQLYIIPDHWVWVKINNLVMETVLGKMLDKKKNKGELKPYLRNVNVRWGTFDLSDMLEMRFEEGEEERYGLQKGDLIICEGGEPGRCAIWNLDNSDIRFQKALHRMRLPSSCVNNKYIYYLMFYASFTGQLEKHFTGTTIKHLTGQGLSNFEVPLCSIEEQNQIVNEIESRLSEADIMEKAIEENLQKAERLRQSILKKAFEGKLVPQDANDEPASELLKRIKEGGEKEDKVFTTIIEGMSTTDLHAGVIALTFEHHQGTEFENMLNHVKHEKVAHMIEAMVGIDLGRIPVQDAAGPDDYNHLKKVEHRAKMKRWFNVKKEKIGHRYTASVNFNALVEQVKTVLGVRLDEVENLIRIMLPMDMERAEIFATTYAAWNNLLMDEKSPSDDEIVKAAREEWSSRKMGLERDRFYRALKWMKEKGYVPAGRGKYVKPMKVKK